VLAFAASGPFAARKAFEAARGAHDDGGVYDGGVYDGGVYDGGGYDLRRTFVVLER
jgi:uncharacterized membrane protein